MPTRDGWTEIDKPLASHAFFPTWSRSVHALHLGGGPDNRRKGGFPDFLLAKHDGLPDMAAVIEVKFWMSLSDQLLTRMWRAMNNGVFPWTAPPGTSSAMKLLKQVRLPYGFWTKAHDLTVIPALGRIIVPQRSCWGRH